MADVLTGAPSDGELLTPAVARITDLWGLSNARLGTILGFSPATASRLRAGASTPDPASKSFEAGQFLLRLFRSLDASMGSDDAARRWLATPNLNLGTKPIDCADTVRGQIALCD